MTVSNSMGGAPKSGGVEDDCINVLENTSPVIADLDCGAGENPDLGIDICAVRDKDLNGLGEDTEKPTSITLTLGDELTSEVVSSQGDKLEVGNVMSGDDGDGSYYILVSDDDDPSKLDKIYFSGDVDAGQSFTANGIDGKFGSETYVHIFSSENGALLQTINFHTSCSAPLVIGDQYGSVSLAGAAVEGKDTGTIYQIGQTETDGDAGVVYEITGGSDADDFTVDPETGEVTFISPPDFENPTDSDGDNKYDVEVTAFQVDAHGVKTGEICEVKKLEVCVEDDCINVLENTSPVIADLDCGAGENPDLGIDICAVRDKDLNGLGEDTEKPTSITLTLGDELTSEVVSSQGDKLEVGNVMSGDDGDGSYYILVSDDDDPSKLDKIYFSGDVDAGQSFTANGIDGKFGSETYVHIFSSENGALLQTINFHTSCSAPLVIGDQYGSVSLAGAAVEGKDTGTIYQIGQTETDGDAGVVYEITGGSDADDFTVDPETGEVTFISPPDFENPTDSDGDNKYDVEVTAFQVDAHGVKTGEICEVKKLEVCVEDQDCINILENTDPGVIADLDCEEEPENPDLGKEICAERDVLKDQGINADKPNQLTLTLNDDLTSVISSGQEGNKLEIETFALENPDGGGLYIRVSDSDKPNDTGTIYFQGDVGFGQSFTALSSAANDDKFGSETYIHIFSADGGQLLQTINYHTSCSAPITIGDQLGLVSLDGVGLLNKDTGETIEFGGATAREIVYEITGGDGFDPHSGTTPFFNVDPETGEVTLAFVPDYENPLDDNGDNSYFVEVTGYYVNSDGSREVCDVKPIEICIEDEPELGSISGRYFCDDGPDPAKDCDGLDNDFVAARSETAIANQRVVLIKAGEGVVASTRTDANGEYEFTDLEAGSYRVRFTAVDGKIFTEANVGNDDTIDSDVTVVGSGGNGNTDFFDLGAGENKTDVDAGVCEKEEEPGSLSGRYFCDTNDNDQDDGNGSEPAVAGVLVMLLDSAGNPAVDMDGNAVASVYTDSNGNYSFGNLAAGFYSVKFTDPDGVLDGKQLVSPNVGDDASDSDAIGDTTESLIENIEVVAGQNTPDNDAGVEYILGSLSGRYFCDTDDDNQDNNNGDEPAIEGVVVELLDAAGNGTGITTTTGPNGYYTFADLLPGTYGVRFTDPDGVLDGKQLVSPNVGDDASDSDAIGDTTSAEITGITVVGGQDTPDNDAGVEYSNRDPEPMDDEGMGCYDEEICIDVLANDTDPDGDILSIASVNGIVLGDTPMDLGDGVTAYINMDGKVCFDGTGNPDVAGLLTGEQLTLSYSYTVADGEGGVAMADVDVTFCGATDTMAKICETLDGVTVTVDLNGSQADVWNLTFTSSDARFNGFFEESYCLDRAAPLAPGVVSTFDATVSLLDEDCFDFTAFTSDTVAQNALDHAGEINWIINNRDTTLSAFTDAEVQSAIWSYTNNNPSINAFYDVGPDGTNDYADILALSDLEADYEVPIGGLVAAIINPDAATSVPAGTDQPFIVGLSLFEDCIC